MRCAFEKIKQLSNYTEKDIIIVDDIKKLAKKTSTNNNLLILEHASFHKIPFIYLVLKKGVVYSTCLKITTKGNFNVFEIVNLTFWTINKSAYKLCGITKVKKIIILNEFFKIKQRQEPGVFTPKF